MDITIDTQTRTAALALDARLDADGILDLMGRLAQARARLTGEIDDDSGLPVQLCAGAIDAGPAAGGMRLAIRHPQLGWVLTHVPLPRLAELVATGASVLANTLAQRTSRPGPPATTDR